MTQIVFTLLLFFLSYAWSETPEPLPSSFIVRVGCNVHLDCTQCSTSDNCVWCQSNSMCIDGNGIGAKDVSLCSQWDWRWKQCNLSGLILIIIICSVVGVLLLFLIGCLCKCFCCTGKKISKNEYKELLEDNQKKVKESVGATAAKYREKRKELSAKYGININRKEDSESSLQEI